MIGGSDGDPIHQGGEYLEALKQTPYSLNAHGKQPALMFLFFFNYSFEGFAGSKRALGIPKGSADPLLRTTALRHLAAVSQNSLSMRSRRYLDYSRHMLGKAVQ